MADTLDFIEELERVTGDVEELFDDTEGRSVAQGSHILLAINAIGDSFTNPALKIEIGKATMEQRNFIFWNSEDGGLAINAEGLAHMLKIAASELDEKLDLEEVENWLSNIFMTMEPNFKYYWQGRQFKKIAESLHYAGTDDEVDLSQMMEDVRDYLT